MSTEPDTDISSTPLCRRAISAWLNTLPRRYRTRALDNLKGSGSMGVTNLPSAIYCAFVWADSPEGHNFWEQLAKWAEGNVAKGPRIPKGK